MGILKLTVCCFYFIHGRVTRGQLLLATRHAPGKLSSYVNDHQKLDNGNQSYKPNQ